MYWPGRPFDLFVITFYCDARLSKLCEERSVLQERNNHETRAATQTTHDINARYALANFDPISSLFARAYS